MMKGLVGIPVFNEAGNLGAVLAELLDRFPAHQLLFITMVRRTARTSCSKRPACTTYAIQ